MIWLIVIGGSLAFYLFCEIQLCRGMRNLPRGQQKTLPRVSIIIAMRDEQENVRRCLEAVIRQQYPRHLFEIVVADDGSVDRTPVILAEYQRQCPSLRVLRIENRPADWSRKKYALQQAIAHSSGEVLLFTDADCVPPPNWVRSMVACFAADIGLVAGFSPLIDPSHSLLGEMLACDSLAAAVVAAGGIGLGRPITAVGRNLAYRRAVFEEVGGLAKLKHHLSGDDDLFLQMIHRTTRWRCGFAVAPGSIVPSYQTISWRHFVIQKRRHLSAGKGYDFGLQASYFFFHVSNLVLMMSCWIASTTGGCVMLAVMALAVKVLADKMLLGMGAHLFGMNRRLKYLLPWEIFFVLSHLLIGPLAWLGPVKWKMEGRTSSSADA